MLPAGFQTEVGIVTAFLALLSVLLDILPPLPSKLGGFIFRFPAEVVVTELKKDPFNIAIENDFIDGTPTGVSAHFWNKVSRRSIVFVLLQVIIISGWFKRYKLSEETTHYDEALYIFGALCLLRIASRPFSSQNKTRDHARSTRHLSFLLTVKVLLTLTIAALPSSSEQAFAGEILIKDSNGWTIDVLCSFISWVVVVTTPVGPALHYPPEKIYSAKILSSSGTFPDDNVCKETTGSLYGALFYSYTSKVFLLGRSTNLTTLDQLPILPANMRARVNLAQMKYVLLHIILPFKVKAGSGFLLAYQLLRVNFLLVSGMQSLAVVATGMFYLPIVFIQQFLSYLENDPGREDRAWGWFYVGGIFVTQALVILANTKLNSLSGNDLNTRLRLQMNTLLYAKTLVRKDIPSFSGVHSSSEAGETDTAAGGGDLSSKSEVINLMTTDVGRASKLSRIVYAFTDCAISISVGTYMLYNLLGVSTFVGLAIAVVLVPLNQLAGNFVVAHQENVMKCRDERVALTNEFLTAIRMIKFMAWERTFERRVLKVRERELGYQKQIFQLQTLRFSLEDAIPLLFALGCFWHFAVIRREELGPTIAFTSIVVFSKIRHALTMLPNSLVDLLQAFESLRRIEKYLNVQEVKFISLADYSVNPPSTEVAFHSATFTWERDTSSNDKKTGSMLPDRGFSIVDVSVVFPRGEISLICGKIGSGKTLLLLALLGEVDILTGRVACPRSPVDAHSLLMDFDGTGNWIVEGICAYVPQTPWLRNQSIRENILFNLPLDVERYSAVIEACALMHDLSILEDGDKSEIGEQGINLSGGQKARISLARAVYSHASVLLLDDVLSAVDIHTVHHLWNQCFKGPLMNGRTIILVSHHIELCGPDSGLILALDNGRVQHSGSWTSFQGSTGMRAMLTSLDNATTLPVHEVIEHDDVEAVLEHIMYIEPSNSPTNSADTIESSLSTPPAMIPREIKKLVKKETCSEGHISKDIWLSYVRTSGSFWFWMLFWTLLLFSAFSPILENSWLRVWSASKEAASRPIFYMSVYAAIVVLEIIVKVSHWLVLYHGSIRASTVLYQKLLEAVMFANIRFHDTISRGSLRNCFGKDFEDLDNELPSELGRTLLLGITLTITLATLTFIGGRLFILTAVVIIGISFTIAQTFGRIARDLRRLSSITSSPLFSIYGETISGLSVIRAFGMSTKFLNDMVVHADTNMIPTYWSMGINRLFDLRFQLSAAPLLGIISLTIFLDGSVDASWAGLALAFASTLTQELYWFVRRWVEIDQVMVAFECIKEYSDLPSEGAEFIEPRPPAAWPTAGLIQCENLTVSYDSGLPDILHDVSFEIKPGEKIGIVGRTGSGKSTLGLALMRFIEAKKGCILIDGVDIAAIGLADLRSRLTIIPQDPILLSGTLRSTLDVLGEYDDADIFQALKRVNLLSSSADDGPSAALKPHKNATFQDLDTRVSELGDNFSVGEKQLLCMARALLRRSKILLMDEATASVDYATDEIISKTIREEFSDSTILTIAHRLHTVIGYDRIMVMDEGRIVEFDSPRSLIANENTRFHKLCKATGAQEFAKLTAMIS